MVIGASVPAETLKVARKHNNEENSKQDCVLLAAWLPRVTTATDVTLIKCVSWESIAKLE